MRSILVLLALCVVSCGDSSNVPLTIEVRGFPSGFGPRGLDLAIDLSAAEGPHVTRGILWDGRDPFRFEVLVPPQRYEAASVVASQWYVCPSGDRQFSVSSGSNPVGFTVPIGSVLSVSLQNSPEIPTCAP